MLHLTKRSPIFLINHTNFERLPRSLYTPNMFTSFPNSITEIFIKYYISIIYNKVYKESVIFIFLLLSSSYKYKFHTIQYIFPEKENA